MGKLNNKLVAKLFRDIADKIEEGSCGLDEEELNEIANNILHVKLNIEQTCKYLNCSRATLNRMIISKRVPQPKKEAGGKEYWFRDELDDYISNNK